MAQAHTLKSLRVNEISLVDVPANPGAMHLLFKRKESPVMSKSKTADGPLDRLLAKLGLVSKSGARDPVDPDTYIDATTSEIDKAANALDQSIASILADNAVSDKTGEIAKAMAQFRTYLGDKVPDQIEKAMRDVAMVTLDKKDDPTMATMDELGAQVADLTKQLKDTQTELAKAKMSPAHAKYCADKGMDGDATAAFAAKSADERDAVIAAKPVSKQADPTVSVELTKALNEVTDLQKRVASFEAERELVDFRKRATAAGLAESHAETILKASKGDADAFAKMLDLMKAANQQAKTGAIFKEFGSTGSAAAGSAAAEVAEKAEALIKADPKLSMIAARVQVRKAHADLAQRERDEERAAIRAVS